jgi:hypothetical protein
MLTEHDFGVLVAHYDYDKIGNVYYDELFQNVSGLRRRQFGGRGWSLVTAWECQGAPHRIVCSCVRVLCLGHLGFAVCVCACIVRALRVCVGLYVHFRTRVRSWHHCCQGRAALAAATSPPTF